MEENNIEVLNVAGNAEETAAGTYAAARLYLSKLFTLVAPQAKGAES